MMKTVNPKYVKEDRGGDREPVVTKTEVGEDARSGFLTTTTRRVGDEEGRRGRNTVELNQNQTPDRGQYKSPYRIPEDIPPILLPNPHLRLV